MEIEQNQNPKPERPMLLQLWHDILNHRKLYYIVLPVTFVVVAILSLSIPNYYQCKVMLAPELSGNKSTSGLASIASNFGVNLNTNSGADALFPTLYPDLMNSVSFRASLFPVKVRREDDSTAAHVMTYYDYLKDEQKAPWWSAAKKAVFGAITSLFTSEKPDGKKDVNAFQLTKEQTKIVEAIEKKVVCDVDKKTMVITINVTDQDPLICATMADSVQARLQDFITDYRTKKARVDLAFNQKLYAEAKARYEKARKEYAGRADANRNVLFQAARSEIAKYENEMNIQYQAYSQVAAQLRLAEAKVQEDTPAFTTLQPATVPIKKAGPKRAQTCLIFLFLAFLATTVYIIHREGHLLPFFFADDDDDLPPTIDSAALLQALLNQQNNKKE